MGVPIMPASRKIFAFAVLLLIFHCVVIEFRSATLSNLAEFILIALASAACFQTSRSATGIAYRFWRLMSLAFTIYAVGVAFATYYESVLHASTAAWWPSDVLFLFHVAPMALALFLYDEPPDTGGYQWQIRLDFLQIGIVALSGYLFFLYIPMVTQQPGALNLRTWHVENWRNAILTAAFILRAVFTKSRLIRSLYGRVAIFLILFSLGDAIYIYAQDWRHLATGTWYELLWTVPRTVMIWLAVSWKQSDEPQPTLKQSSAEALLLAQFSHVVSPFLVLVMASTAFRSRPTIAVAAVGASFVCSSVRMMLSQHAQNALLSKQQHLAESLRAAEAKFRGLLESAPDPIVAVNQDGRIVLVNAQAEKSFGYRREDLLGQPLEILIPERLRERCSELRRAFFSAPQTDQMGTGVELHGLRKDGSEFPVEVNLSLLETPEGFWGSAAIRDLTERRKLQQQFIQAQKMESVGTLAGGVAHDFNNLLTVILSYGGLIAEDSHAEPNLRIAAHQILAAAERGASLTRQMLAFSRQQVFELRVLNLNDIVQNVSGMLQRVIGEHIQIRTTLASNLGSVKADAGQLEQVLMNLSVNARDAMPRGGELFIETENVELGQEFVEGHMGSKPGPHVLLAVTDIGTGIDPTILQHIFEPFFTTKEVGRGTGLGLAMVYGIVKQSGGYIGVSSEVGRGTSFKIYLPRVAGPADIVPAQKVKAETARGRETILLAEDDPAVRQLIESILDSRGYTVLAPEDPADVASVCSQHAGPIHLLLTDLIMPGIGGRELAEQVAALRPAVRVLYMSGYTDDAVIHGQGFNHASAFLQKPFTPGSLAAKVRELLDSRQS